MYHAMFYNKEVTWQVGSFDIDVIIKINNEDLIKSGYLVYINQKSCTGTFDTIVY